MKKCFADNDRLQFHLMPPEGWLNDPNGLCWFHGFYHVFFQYSPKEPLGGLKSWGHYRSKDFIHWEYMGEPVKPDTDYDRDGAYSGCAFTGDGLLELFYTGNVKHAGDYDYINDGREAHVLYMSSADGVHFSEKELLLSNKDYPADYTCHVRDPKVWKEKDTYFMVLGGRKKNGAGAVLLYSSMDKKNWKFQKEVSDKEGFGYMWECPDVISFGEKTVLSFCPQGLEREEYLYENKYQSGYVLWNGGTGLKSRGSFTEWDRGFDFYAPQTFTDGTGRQILIGWAGMIDTYYGNERTVRRGWQHALTVPRELTLDSSGQFVLQNPVKELEGLRGKPWIMEDGRTRICYVSLEKEAPAIWEAVVIFSDPEEEKEIIINNELAFTFQDSVVSLSFFGEAGEGRDVRKALLKKCEEVRILMDASLIEIYVNGGEMVFTSRYYPGKGKKGLEITGKRESMVVYPWKSFTYEEVQL